MKEKGQRAPRIVNRTWQQSRHDAGKDQGPSRATFLEMAVDKLLRVDKAEQDMREAIERDGSIGGHNSGAQED